MSNWSKFSSAIKSLTEDDAELLMRIINYDRATLALFGARNKNSRMDEIVEALLNGDAKLASAILGEEREAITEIP